MPNSKPFIIGYLPDWQGDVNASQIEKLTHVNYAFLLPNDDGEGVQPLKNPAKLKQLVALAHTHGVKVIISVGGWNDGNDSGFRALSASPAGIQAFSKTLTDFCDAYQLDGVDIDWEHPKPDDDSARNYAALMKALSEALHRQGRLLTAAVVFGTRTADGIWTEVFDAVDYLLLMAYDGGDGPLHSPYSLAVTALDYWQGRGLPKSKTVLGVPFYGRPTWTPYKDLVAADPQAPHTDVLEYHGATIHHNGLETITAKTRLALERGAGVMMWELSHDTGDHTSLLNAIYQTIHASAPPD